MPAYTPAQGDLIWIDMSPQAGHEEAGRRPALVLSPHSYNRRSGLAVVCPITRQVKGYPFEVPLPRTTPVAGVILADQIRNVDWQARHADRIGHLDEATLAEVWAKVRVLLAPEAD
jgi:mRNA interferase MazF